MCYPVCGMMHIKEPLLLIRKSSPFGGNGFPLSLSEWIQWILVWAAVHTFVYAGGHLTFLISFSTFSSVLNARSLS